MARNTPERSELKIFEGSKMPWGERKSLIGKVFPSTVALDWEKVFRSDPNILGQLVNDILKVDSAVPGKPGKRPALDIRAAEDRLRQMVGDDYTALPFVDSVYVLLGKRSILWLSSKSGVNKSHLYRVMTQKIDPPIDVIESVAKALDKDPSYFPEYRHAYIMGILSSKLESMPDATVVFYTRMKNGSH